MRAVKQPIVLTVGALSSVGALLFFSTVPSHAASVRDTGQELRRVDQNLSPADRSGRAVRKSRELRFIRGREVTYEEVLRHPDDVPLNLGFARTQIRNGDLIGASATLERILLVAPDNLDIHILYAIVLYRLDNLDEAQSELTRVLALPLPDDLRAELTDYLNEIKRRKRRNKFTITAQNAYVYDTNRNSSPSSGAIDTQFGRIQLFGTDRKVPDSSYQGQVRVDWEHDLGFQRQHRVVASIRGIHSDQARLDELTLSGLDGRVGVVLDFNPYTIEPYVTSNYVLLSHELYYRSVGVGLRGSTVVSTNLKFSLFGTAIAQKFDGLTEAPEERQRSGAEYRVGMSIEYALRADMRLGFLSTFVRKAAVAGFFRFTGVRLRLEHEYLLGRGIFLLSHLGWEFEQYDAPRLSESPMRRRQHRFRAGTTVGVPLSLIVPYKRVAVVTRRTTLVAGVDFTRESANITNYSDSNWRFMIGLTIRAER
jgi:tetratricopeptide (TPR) repeat protein